MLTDETLKTIQLERERQILAAERARLAVRRERHDGGFHEWLHGRSATPSVDRRSLPQAGRPATDPSA
jgi:hypothetical protein